MGASSSTHMKLFNTIAQQVTAYDQRREAVIKASREILRTAKQTIFMLHEGNVEKAEKQLDALTKRAIKQEKQFAKPVRYAKAFDPYGEGSWNAGIEEYLEAYFLYAVLKRKSLVLPQGISAPAHVIIGALCDMTGELVRVAVIRGSKKDVKEIERLRKVAATVVEHLLPLHLTGNSRQKFDAAKRNLKRLEEIVYEVNIRS